MSFNASRFSSPFRFSARRPSPEARRPIKPPALKTGDRIAVVVARQLLQSRGVRSRDRGTAAARIRAGVRRLGLRDVDVHIRIGGRARGRLQAGVGRPGRRGAAGGSWRLRQRAAAAGADGVASAAAPKLFIGYSDNTSLLSWLNCQCGMTALFGPMIEGRLARGAEGYRRNVVPAACAGGRARGWNCGRRDCRSSSRAMLPGRCSAAR